MNGERNKDAAETKRFPLSREVLERVCRDHPTPFHLYDEEGIRRNARRLLAAFSWNRGFREYFAVKATPNPFILSILREEGFGADASSLAELVLSERSGITGESVMFSSNDTPVGEFAKAAELGAIINLDDISHIPVLERTCGIPEVISVRYNPGKLRTGTSIMGNPEEAKYGFTREQVFEGLATLRDKGARRFGLHSFIVSNELKAEYLADTASMLFDLAREVRERLGIRVEFVNMSGGFGIPYRPGEQPLDIEALSAEIRARYERIVVPAGLDPLALYLECGRFVTGPYGWLVSRVLHVKRIYKTHVGLDACMANLMRPAIYGAYHHVTVAGKENLPAAGKYDVTGSLCESFDRFAVDRELPEIGIGDLVVIHDAGAHGHSMGFNYNGKLRSAELLLRSDGSVLRIRRAETLDDHFGTLDFGAVGRFAQREAADRQDSEER